MTKEEIKQLKIGDTVCVKIKYNSALSQKVVCQVVAIDLDRKLPVKVEIWDICNGPYQEWVSPSRISPDSITGKMVHTLFEMWSKPQKPLFQPKDYGTR